MIKGSGTHSISREWNTDQCMLETGKQMETMKTDKKVDADKNKLENFGLQYRWTDRRTDGRPADTLQQSWKVKRKKKRKSLNKSNKNPPSEYYFPKLNSSSHFLLLKIDLSINSDLFLQ